MYLLVKYPFAPSVCDKELPEPEGIPTVVTADSRAVHLHRRIVNQHSLPTCPQRFQKQPFPLASSSRSVSLKRKHSHITILVGLALVILLAMSFIGVVAYLVVPKVLSIHVGDIFIVHPEKDLAPVRVVSTGGEGWFAGPVNCK